MKEYYPKDKLFEKLAAIEHERWADWQSYVHSKLQLREGDGCFLSMDDCRHWQRQIDTQYNGLSEEEKDADRAQVMRYWHLIKK